MVVGMDHCCAVAVYIEVGEFEYFKDILDWSYDGYHPLIAIKK